VRVLGRDCLVPCGDVGAVIELVVAVALGHATTPDEEVAIRALAAARSSGF
jgi:hypothetical protein